MVDEPREFKLQINKSFVNDNSWADATNQIKQFPSDITKDRNTVYWTSKNILEGSNCIVRVGGDEVEALVLNTEEDFGSILVLVSGESIRVWRSNVVSGLEDQCPT